MKGSLPWLIALGAGFALLYNKADEVERAVDPKKVKGSIPERFFAELTTAKANLDGKYLLADYERIKSKYRVYLTEKGLAPDMVDAWFKEWVSLGVGVHPTIEKPETEEEKKAALAQLANDILADLG
jgi:hypothetical protein